MSASSSRRGLWIALGAIFIVGGLVAGVLLWVEASQRENTAIENFARAPIGCDTTLDFIEPGEYLLFIETRGNLDGVRGDCDVEGPYDSADQPDPDVDITIVDPDGEPVDLDRSFGDIAYEAAGFVGSARFSIDIAETDDHVLRAESDADDVFVVAVGRDPSDGVAALRIGAIAAGIIGLLVGLIFVLLGARRSNATVRAAPWTPGAPAGQGGFVPGGAPPQGPPVYGQPSGPPQYGQQPPAPYGQYPPGQPGAPYAGAPQYRHPPAPPQPPPPQFQPPPAPQPDIPGQPSFPQAPSDPAGSAQQIEWAHPSETPPDAEVRAQHLEERPTEERPPPPPPE